MKKISVLLIFLLILSFVLPGCNNGTEADQRSSIWLGDELAVAEKTFEINKNGTVTVDFDVPETGYIKLVAFDSTEYINWPDEIPDFYVDFKDEKGRTLYENICISSGYLEKYKVDAGKVTAEISSENGPAKMKMIHLMWAYATDNYEPVELDYGTASAATADENGVARFRLFVNKPSLIRIYSAEAGIFESDCSFYVETVGGERATGDLKIHGTEWTSRLVFLDKGEYIIVVSGIEAVASCKAVIEKSYTAIQLDDAEGMTAPVVFGLNSLNNGERTAKFTVDGSKKYLVIETKGEGTFYDSVHCVDFTVTDANGDVVAQSEEEDCVSDETRVDISDFKGEYMITFSTGGSCVVEISVIDG